MKLIERIGLAALKTTDPERAHGLTIKAIRNGLTPTPGAYTSPRLAQEFCGMNLPNPVGLAAGFDKNAEAIHGLLRTGFGFIEVLDGKDVFVHISASKKEEASIASDKARRSRSTPELTTMERWPSQYQDEMAPPRPNRTFCTILSN